MQECSTIDQRIMIDFLAKPNGFGELLSVSTVILVSDYSNRKRGAAGLMNPLIFKRTRFWHFWATRQ